MHAFSFSFPSFLIFALTVCSGRHCFSSNENKNASFSTHMYKALALWTSTHTYPSKCALSLTLRTCSVGTERPDSFCEHVLYNMSTQTRKWGTVSRTCPFSKKKTEIWVCEKNSRVFQERVWVYICTLLRDRDKLESHLLVPMNFWDKLHRPKLVNFFSVLH